MNDSTLSMAFVDEVARFDGTASQVARLRARASMHVERPTDDTDTGARPRPDSGSRRVRRRSLERFLLWLAGVNFELVSRSYVDRARYTTVGVAILVTGAISTLSFFLVVSSSGVSPVVAVPVSIPWTVLIITVVRSLAASAARRFGNFRTALIGNIVPGVICTVTALIIAQPLMLRVFEPAIESQIQESRVVEGRAFVAEQFSSEPVRLLQGQVNDAQAKLDKAQNTYLQANAQVQCNLDGTCGTHEAGLDLATARAIDAANSAQRDVTAAQSEYNAQEARFQTEVAQIQHSASVLQARPVGLLEQLQAFDQVASQNLSVALASIFVVLLLAMVQVLPALLAGLGRRRVTLYERLLAIQERSARDQFEVEAAHAVGERLVDRTDPEVDNVLREFEEQRDEIGQATEETLAKVIQLAEKRKAKGSAAGPERDEHSESG